MTYFDGYSLCLEGKFDSLTGKLKCKPGYVQRGAACQPKLRQRSGLPLAAAAVGLTAIVAAPALIMIKEVQAGVTPEKGTEPPRVADLSSDEIKRKYDNFQPGDILRKTFEIAPETRVWHYAVYTGKNKKTGEHEVIDVHDAPKVDGKHTAMPQESDPATDSIYEKMPEEKLSNDRIRDRNEILARAEEFANMDEWNYSLGTNNCEVFARGVVENRPISKDGDSVSQFSKTVSKNTIDQVFKLMNENRGLEIPELQRRLDEASARYRRQQILKSEFSRQDSPAIDPVNQSSLQDLFTTKPVALNAQRRKESIIEEEFLAALGLISPKQYQRLVNSIAGSQPKPYQNYIRTAMMKEYLTLVLGESVLINEMAREEG
jgi:hypothetical protein